MFFFWISPSLLKNSSESKDDTRAHAQTEAGEKLYTVKVKRDRYIKAGRSGGDTLKVGP